MQSGNSFHDVIIVGSGPAGMSTALHLVHLRPELADRILVLEAKRHPRPKLCAGGILQDGVRILRKLGLDFSSLPQIGVKEAHFRFEGRGICVALDPVSFTVIRREAFDAWLAGEARGRGIRVEEDVRVTGVRARGDEMEVLAENAAYRAGIVVGADGTHSAVRRFVTAVKGGGSSIVLEFTMAADEFKRLPVPAQDKAFFDFSVIHKRVQGYIWQFPKPGGAAAETACTRGIYHARVFPRRPAPALKSILQARVAEELPGPDGRRMGGFPIRYFDPRGVFSAQRVLLVGDAAGVDPIYGEGISFALGYGGIAAREIAAALENRDFSFSRYGRRILRSPMGRCLRRRVKVARILYLSSSRAAQRLIWWRLGFLLKWIIENFLIGWEKG